MTDAAPAEDRYAALRAHAAQRRRATVKRLGTAITSLKARGEPITAFTIKCECGLDATTIHRNADARRLFQEESTYLQAKRQARRARRRMSQHQTGPLPDPAAHALLPVAAKPRLLAMLHATQAECDDLQRRYQALLQEHAQCGVALLTLKATVARYEQFLGRYRRTVQQQEQALDE